MCLWYRRIGFGRINSRGFVFLELKKPINTGSSDVFTVVCLNGRQGVGQLTNEGTKGYSSLAQMGRVLLARVPNEADILGGSRIIE
jgi:hypothetical protein